MPPLPHRLASLALSLATLLCVGPAAAQQKVLFHLQVPAGHPGVAVGGVTLLRSAAIVGETDTPITVFGGVASVSLTIPVTDVPDEVELDFAVPAGGIATLYDVSGADFAFDQMYFLPNPSAGGSVGPQPGDATDAFFELSLVTSPPPPADRTSPTCSFSQPAPGELDATIQDSGSGLASIAVQLASNLSVSVPAFAPATTDPVTVVAQVVNSSRSATLLLKAVDEAGNAAYCKKVVSRSSRTRTRTLGF
jgi:hypothetical protein